MVAPFLDVDTNRPLTKNVLSSLDLESRFYAVLSKAASKWPSVKSTPIEVPGTETAKSRESVRISVRHEISVSNTLIYLDELYSSILRGTSRNEYLFLQSVFLTPWLLADRSWCRVQPAPLNQSEWWSLKSN